MADIKVLILAAGDSDRFWPLGDKQNLLIFKKPVIHYCLAQLEKFGFKKIIIVVNASNKKSLEKLSKDFPKLNLEYVEQTDKRGMAGALISAQEQISNNHLLVINPTDIYEDILISAFLKLLSSDNPDGVIAGITTQTYFPGGYLKILGDKVVEIIEKPAKDKLPSNIVEFVFHYFQNPQLLIKAIEKVKTDKDDHYEQAINVLTKSGVNINFLPYKGFWGYLKYPWHVLNVIGYYLSLVKAKREKEVIIDKSAAIIGEVYLGQGVRVLENAKILGPAYIGDRTIIGNNVVVRESFVGADCVVGYGTEIARSFVGERNWFHSNYIGDSVISSNVSMGAGTVLANFRLDEEIVKSKVKKDFLDTGRTKLGAIIGSNVRIGVNTSVMPGIKIGKNCLIGANLLLDQDLPDNSFCKLIQKIQVVKNNKSVTSRQIKVKS